MCILCELKKAAAKQSEERTSEVSLSEVAKHARALIAKENLHPVEAIYALQFLLPVMKDPEMMLELLVKADDEMRANKAPRTGDSTVGSNQRVEELEKEVARLNSQINLQATNGKAMGDALASLSASMNIELPVLDGSNPRSTVKALSNVADKLESHKAGIEFWMREITNRYDLNKTASH